MRTTAAAAVAALLLAIAFALGMQLAPEQSGGLAVPAADSVDVGFSQDMTVHHQQAVEMAGIAYATSQEPLVRSLAFDILTSQQAQIGQMQGWLMLWEQPLLPTGRFMTWMPADAMAADAMGDGAMGDGAGGVEQMPGMATPADLAALRAATGPAQDTLFLQLMLRHHQGGAGMLAYGAEAAQQAPVATLAAQAASIQAAEAEQMTEMLAQRGASPLPIGG